MSLRSRLTVATVALLSIAIAVALLTAYLLVRHELRSEIDGSLKSRAAAITAVARQLPVAAPTPPPLTKLPRAAFGEPDSYIQFVNRSGKIVLRPGEHVRLPLGSAQAVAAGRQPAYYADAVVAHTHVRIYIGARSRRRGRTRPLPP